MGWINENGEYIDQLGDMDNSHLLFFAQRMVDVFRHHQDECLFRMLKGSEFDEDHACHMHKPLVFTYPLTELVAECQKRGLPLNTSR